MELERRARRRKSSIFENSRTCKLMVITFAALAVVSLLLAVILLIAGGSGRQSGPVAVEGEKVYLSENYLGQTWIAALPGVEKNPFDAADFVRSGQFIDYQGSGKSYRGIDVSAHHQEIDWAKVKADGIEFAMLRVGYRGYGNGAIVEDEYFRSYIEGAQAQGIDVGVYFFSQAISVAEAEEEAAWVLETIDGYKLQYPVVFDWEIIGADTARTNDVAPDVLTDCAVAFCETVRNAGYEPMVYAGQRLALFKLDLRPLAAYDLWIAEYDEYPDFFYNFQMWQYTDSATVAGINGDADLNICFVKY